MNVLKAALQSIGGRKNRERLLRELAVSGAWVDFTQGLDIRLVDGLEKRLTSIKIKRLHFAWDNPEQDLRPQFKTFKEKIGITGYRRLGVYVLTNYNSTHEQDLERVYFLRELGYAPYIMIYEKETAPPETRFLQRWVNNRIIFLRITTRDADRRKTNENQNYKKLTDKQSTNRPVYRWKVSPPPDSQFGAVKVAAYTRYEAMIAAAKLWRTPWTPIARECVIENLGAVKGAKA